jgi:hypothetical protein
VSKAPIPSARLPVSTSSRAGAHARDGVLRARVTSRACALPSACVWPALRPPSHRLTHHPPTTAPTTTTTTHTHHHQHHHKTTGAQHEHRQNPHPRATQCTDCACSGGIGTSHTSPHLAHTTRSASRVGPGLPYDKRQRIETRPGELLCILVPVSAIHAPARRPTGSLLGLWISGPLGSRFGSGVLHLSEQPCPVLFCLWALGSRSRSAAAATACATGRIYQQACAVTFRFKSWRAPTHFPFDTPHTTPIHRPSSIPNTLCSRRP